MSQYERRRRSNVLSGDGSRLPNGGNTRVGQTGSGHLAASSVCLGGRLDRTGTHANGGSRGEDVGKPGVAGVYTNQRLNLSKPWKGLRMTCQGFKPDPGNLAVRHYRGASRNIRNGETVNPPAIERAGSETPHLQQGALDLYPNRGTVERPAGAPVLDPTDRPRVQGRRWSHLGRALDARARPVRDLSIALRRRGRLEEGASRIDVSRLHAPHRGSRVDGADQGLQEAARREARGGLRPSALRSARFRAERVAGPA